MKSKAVRNLVLAASLVSVMSLAVSQSLADSAATIFGATSGSTVTYDNASGSYPVITSILSEPGTVNGLNYSSWAFLAQDSIGSLDMYGALPGGSSYVPTAGDAISVSGTFSPYHQIPEIGTMTAINLQSSLNPVPSPLTETVSSLNVTTLPQSIAGFPIEIKNATISGQSAGDTFGTTSLSLTVTDGTGSMTLYYWPTSYSKANANLYGQTIPTGPVNIIGINSVYNNTTPEFIPIQITTVPEPASVAVFAVGGLLLLALGWRRRRAFNG